MKFWILLGLRDFRFAQSALENVLRSTAPDVQVLVVETGEGAGAWQGAGEVLRQDTPGVVPFLRAAFKRLRQVAGPDDWFVRFDADDYYGPEYLSGVRRAVEAGADVAVVGDVYLRTATGRLLLSCSERPLHSGAPGGTLAGRISRALDFQAGSLPWGEDALWCRQMHAAGATFHEHSGRGYAMCRHVDHEHTLPVSAETLAATWRGKAYDLGPWDPRIVDGEISVENPPLLEFSPERVFEDVDHVRARFLRS